jgi:hypothetical protein
MKAPFACVHDRSGRRRRPLPIESADFAGPRAALAALDAGSAAPRPAAEPVANDADQREKLRALGYVE